MLSSADQLDQTRGAQGLRSLRRIAHSLCPRGLWHSHCGNLLYKSAFCAFRDPSLRPSRYPNVQQRLLRSTATAAILPPFRCDIPHYVVKAAVLLTGVSALRATAWSRSGLLPAAAAAGVPGLCWPARLSATASAAGSLCVRPKFSSRTLIEYRPAAALCRVVSSPHSRKMMVSAWRV